MTERNQKKDQKDMFGKYDSDGEWDESLEKQLESTCSQIGGFKKKLRGTGQPG